MRWFSARPSLPLLLAVAAVLVAAGPALAAAGADHPEETGGLSFLQLKRYDLGIFTLIVFGLLVLILQKFAWPKISEGLAKREAAIFGARDEAQRARVEAEELRSKLQRDYADAQEKIRGLMEEARREADALRAQEREAGAKDAAAERERARREIEIARDAALNDIYKLAVDLATSVSARTITRHISADDHRQLLDESLAELRQTAAGRSA